MPIPPTCPSIRNSVAGFMVTICSACIGETPLSTATRSMPSTSPCSSTNWGAGPSVVMMRRCVLIPSSVTERRSSGRSGPQGTVAEHRPDPQPQTVEDLFPRYGLVVGVYAGGGHRQARLRGAAGVAVYDLAEGLRRADAGDQGGISGRQRGPPRDLGRPEHVVAPQEGLDPVQLEHRFSPGNLA